MLVKAIIEVSYNGTYPTSRIIPLSQYVYIYIYMYIYISLYFPKWYSLSIPRSYKVVPQWCFSRWFLGYPPWSSSMYLPENLVKLELCLPVSLTNWGSMLYFKRWCPQTWLEKKQSKWRIEWQNQRRKSKMIHCSVRLREGIWGWKNWTNVADEKCEAIPVNICIGMGIHICNMCVVPFASLYIYIHYYIILYIHIYLYIYTSINIYIHLFVYVNIEKPLQTEFQCFLAQTILEIIAENPSLLS